MAEHQKSKVNRKEEHKKERARDEAEKLMAKRDAEEAGEDYERSQFWNYSAESVERWTEKEEAKRIRMDNKFTGKAKEIELTASLAQFRTWP